MKRSFLLTIVAFSVIIAGCGMKPLAINDRGDPIFENTPIFYKPGATLQEGIELQTRLIHNLLKTDMAAMPIDCLELLVVAMEPYGYRYTTPPELPSGLVFGRGKHGIRNVAGLPQNPDKPLDAHKDVHTEVQDANKGA